MFQSITEVEKNYPNWYAPDALLPYDDQKFIWENSPIPEDDNKQLNNNITDRVILSGSVISSGKLAENDKKTPIKLLENFELTKCDYKTPPKIIANLLENIFGTWGQKPEHWLYIARRYTPKTINSVIYQINKRIDRGEVNPINNGAYFTSVIKHKRVKKIYRKEKRNDHN